MNIINKKNTLAIVPARGGSKRLKRKNLYPLLGKPMIQYSLDILKNLGDFATPFISTEDEEIFQYCQNQGFSMPYRRPKNLSEDDTSIIDVILDTVDWYKAKTGRDSYPGIEDPGVISVTKIFNYFKFYKYKTEVMGASFRNIDEIKELAGCDLLTISPKLLTELNQSTINLPKKLDVNKPKDVHQKIEIDTNKFYEMMNNDLMASEKLDEGIKKFSKAIDDLELMLNERLVMLEDNKAVALSA